MYFLCGSKLEERNQETPIERSPCSQGLKKEVRYMVQTTLKCVLVNVVIAATRWYKRCLEQLIKKNNNRSI
jgi:hypothetical protein